MANTYSLNWLESDLRKALLEMPVDIERLEGALKIAYRYHDGQFREHKSGGAKRVPYITHPVGVAKICAELWPYVELSDGLDDILSVALAHDLLEDSAISIKELETTTSPRAAELVQVLTKPVSTAFADRSERNRVFLSSINQAGATAKFVKICDALHNLSRPDSMPASLLKKTIRKAKRDYLPLTIDARLGTEIRCRLENAISLAESVLEETSKRESTHESIEGFLGYCVERASGKMLENHDILDILLELPGLSMVHEGSVPEFEKRVLVEWLEPKFRSMSRGLAERFLEKGELVLSGKGFDREAVRKLSFQKVLVLPVEGPVRDQMHRSFFVLGCNSAKYLPWMTVPSLRAIVAVLSERQRERNARELADYSDWVAKSGLSIDPRRAAELHLTPEQMERLARLSDAAAIESGAILAAVELIGRDLGALGGVLLLEHRIKDAASAATKLVKRAKGDWRGLDDTIGIRVVLVNETAVTAFIEAFQAQGQDPSSVWSMDMGLVPDSIEVTAIQSSSGYQATHICFRVRSAMSNVGKVACEVQVRTVFQDAWARLAHEIQYKSLSRGSRRQQRDLKELSRLCDEADSLADGLTK